MVCAVAASDDAAFIGMSMAVATPATAVVAAAATRPATAPTCHTGRVGDSVRVGVSIAGVDVAVAGFMVVVMALPPCAVRSMSMHQTMRPRRTHRRRFELRRPLPANDVVDLAALDVVHETGDDLEWLHVGRRREQL